MSGHDGQSARTFEVRILRQDGPGDSTYWERHTVQHVPDMNVISVLQTIAARAKTTDGRSVAPVAWDSNCLEEVCGACTMLVNGKTRQACSALVDRLLEANPGEIELRPMSKFPVVRDLVVNRDRVFHSLKRAQAWNPVDDYANRGSGPKQTQKSQERAYPLSECMSCGCCLDACPQYAHVEVERRAGESDADFRARESAVYDVNFIGAHAISQTIYYNAHPTGKLNTNQRVDALMEPGGIQVCGNAQNCVAVCPKQIPLTTSIARAGRQTTKRIVTKWLDR
jgi:succinate dehydrogenase / fumarate reductase iron-sulfur subunit